MKTLALAITVVISAVSAAPGAHWTYGQDNAGPQHWGELDPLYGKCGTGHKQSPIDIVVGAPFVKLQSRPFDKLDYKPLRDVHCGYDGHTVKCEWNATSTNTNDNSITLQGKTYYLTQFHFHSPSEHRINNHFADAELHLVHQSKEDNSLAVIGLMLEVTLKKNPFFEWLIKLDKKVDRVKDGHGFLIKDSVTGLPSKKEQIKYKVHTVDFSSLLKSTKNFTPRWEYEGSLTTPPCDEGVAWNVVKQPIHLGLEQFNALVDLQGFSARFVQSRPEAEK
ncbi:hypothetical protein BX616_004333 [Lobosporangium transversale]|nr:hypothetical protein BX616_004333 [Lobosporangium transversale]